MSSTNRGSVRPAQDFYGTPAWCIERLLPLINWSEVNTFYEPCYGEGIIYDMIPLSDEQKDWSEIDKGRDYLIGLRPNVDLIITNPPYRLAQEFIEQALSHSKTVIMLLRLNYLESIKRHEFWKANPPSHIIVLSTRPSFTGGGTDSTGYGWFIWGGENVIKGNSTQWIRK